MLLLIYSKKGWYTYDFYSEEVGVGKEKWYVIRRMGWGGRMGDRGLASVLDVQSLFLLLKKIGFAP